MPKIQEIYTMMESQKTPYIRIYNTARERLFTFENPTVDETKAQMETLLPFISSYGKIIVEAADEKIKARNYTNSYKWNCEFDKPAGATIAGPHNPWSLPPGYVSNEVMMAKLETLQAEMKHGRELDALKLQMKESADKDPMKHIEKIAPALLYLFGKPIDEVQKISGLYNSAGMGTGAIAGPPTNTLTFSDVEKLPDTEKAKKCQELANELAKHISLEHMIILQQKLIDKLKLDQKFINTIFLYI